MLKLRSIVRLVLVFTILIFPGYGFSSEIISGPWLQAVTEKSIVIMWETDRVVTGIVDYGRTRTLGSSQSSRPFRVPATTKDDSTAILHEVRLVGLQPGTIYHYRVRMKDKRSSTYRFKTLPTRGLIRVAHFADLEAMARGCKKKGEDAIIHHITTYNPDFSVVAGDVGIDSINKDYRGNMRAIHELFSQSAFFPVKGNHDNRDWSVFNQWHNTDMPGNHNEDFYSFDAGAAHFVGLKATGGTKRVFPAAWLENDLSKTNKKWKIVVLENRPDENSSSYHHSSIGWLADVFNKHGVHLVLVNGYTPYRELKGGLKSLGASLTCKHQGWWSLEYDEKGLRAELRENEDMQRKTITFGRPPSGPVLGAPTNLHVIKTR